MQINLSDKLTELFDGGYGLANERERLSIVANHLTKETDPLIAPTLVNIGAISSKIVTLTSECPYLKPDAEMLNFISSLSERKNALDGRFGKPTLANKNAVDSQKYPTYYALNEYGMTSGNDFDKLIVLLMLWGKTQGLNFNNRKKYSLVKACFKDCRDLVHKIDNYLSNTDLDVTKNLLATALKMKFHLNLLSESSIDRSLTKHYHEFVDALVNLWRLSNPDDGAELTDSLFSESDVPEEDAFDYRDFYEPPPEYIDSDLEDNETDKPVDRVPKSFIEQSTYYQRGFAKQKKFYSALSAQHLDNGADILTELEYRSFVEKALNDSDQIATILLLTLTFGAEPKYWWSWHIGNDNHQHTFFADLDRGVRQHPVRENLKYWKPSEQQVNDNILHKAKDFVILPIAQEILTRLRPLNASPKQELGELFSIAIDDIHEACDRWLLENINYGRRITMPKIRNYLYLKAMRVKFDQAAASYLTAQPIFPTHSSVYYSSIKEQTLIEHYYEVFQEFTFDKQIHEAVYIGSNLFCKTSYIHSILEQQRKKVFQCLATVDSDDQSLEALIELHNAYTAYCVFAGLLIIGHRPVNDPFARYMDFIPSLQSIVISDKIVDSNHSSRIAFYSRSFSELIGNYILHIHSMAVKLTNHGHDVFQGLLSNLSGNDNPTLPLFVFIRRSPNGIETYSASEKTINALLPIDLPLNLGRHYLSSRLRELGLDTEYIHYQLGHYGPGEIPFSAVSSLSVSLASKVITPYLNKIADQIGLVAISGLKSEFKSSLPLTIVSNVTSDTKQIATLQRITDYDDRTRKDRQLVKSIYLKYFGQLTDENEAKEFLKQDGNALCTEAVKDLRLETQNDFVKNLALLRYLIQRLARKHGVEITLPTKLLEVGIESFPFSYTDFNYWHQMLGSRKKLYKLLKEQKIDALSNIELYTRFFCSLMLNGRFSDKSRFAFIYQAIAEQQYLIYNGVCFLELKTRKNQVQRISLDSITGFIFLEILERIQLNTMSHLAWKSIQNTLNDFVFTKLNIRLSSLIKGVTIDAFLFMPGTIAAVMSGKRKTASLNKASFLRVLEDVRLKFYAESASTDKSSDEVDFELINLVKAFKDEPKTQYGTKQQIKVLNPFKQALNPSIKMKRKERTNRLHELLVEINESSNAASQIVRLLGMWFVERLNSGGAKKERLAFSTVANYTGLISNSLIELTCQENFLDMDIEDMIDVYNRVIQGHQNNIQSTCALQLAHFHNHICHQYFQIEEIQLEDLEYTSSNEEQAIAANFITPIELKKLQDSTTFNPSSLVSQQLFLQLTLYAKFGFRPFEIFKFESRDAITLNGQIKGYLTCRQNQYGRLKTPGSHRNVLLHDKLTSFENEHFERWVKYRVDNPKQPLWELDGEAETQGMSWFRKKITDDLRRVTGDPSLNIRSLRHTAVSLELLNYHLYLADYEGIQSPITELTENWNAVKTDEYSQALFGHCLPSRRFTYRVSRMVGHAGPLTTLTNYSHWYELMMPCYHVADDELAGNQVLVNLCKKQSINAIAGLKKRAKQKSGTGYAALFLRQLFSSASSKFDNISAEVAQVRARGKLPLSSENYQRRFGIIQAYKLLSLKKAGHTERDVLLDRFELSEDELAHFDQTYHDVYQTSMLDPFYLYSEQSASHTPGITDKLNDGIDCIIGVNKWIADKDNSEIKQVLSLWSQYVDAKRPFWHFETDDQRRDFIQFLKEVLNIDGSQIVIGTDQKVESGKPSFLEGHQYHYAKFALAKPLPRLFHYEVNQPSPGVIVVNQNKTRYLNSEINLILFLANLVFGL